MIRALFASFIIFICFTILYPQDNSSTILIEDFNSDSYVDWTIEGSAFGYGPAGDEDTHQMNGFVGSGYVCSGRDGGDTGTLTSPEFTIEKNTIHFLIGAQETDFPPHNDEYPGMLSVELLVNDKVVREIIPKEFHALFWEAMDVSEYKGQTARIRIVDGNPRRWAHLDVDHIVQNNFPVNGQSISKKLIIDKPVLNFPVKRGAEKYYIELVVDGKQIRAMDVELATDEIDYWVVTELPQWMGSELTVRTKLRSNNNQKLFDRKMILSIQMICIVNLYALSFISRHKGDG